MLTTEELLNKSRTELLDLSTRNRLLSIPVDSPSARIIQIRDELSTEVFRLLVTEEKSFSFAPGRPSSSTRQSSSKRTDEDSDEAGLPQPDEAKDDKTGLARRHVNSRLQTSLSPEGLQRRLFDLHHDARAMIEEQGVNVLYLVLGHLKWFEAADAGSPRYAPLLLIPVALSRKSATDRFLVKYNGDDIEENLSLRARLKKDFDVDLPAFPDEESLNPSNYFAAVRAAAAKAPNWEVSENEMTLGFFSFAKFLMYRDLDARNWPNPDMLLKQPFVSGLLQDGFPSSEPLFADDVDIDQLVPASHLDHVVDADGTQTLAIEAVRAGRSLVIQGPPGTGKSQSITNIIATAVLAGKRVLFVAEKLAALEVVKRRLEREGLGALALELHSNKSNKRVVIEEIGRTWKLGRPRPLHPDGLVSKLEDKRTVLNDHAHSLHEKHEASGLTPFQVIGHCAALEKSGLQAAGLSFEGLEQWTNDHRATHRALVTELAQRIEQIGLPVKHPWRGVQRETILNIDIEPLLNRIREADRALKALRGISVKLATEMGQPAPVNLAETEEQQIIGDYVAQAPKLDKHALCNGVWNAGMGGLEDLVALGKKFIGIRERLGSQVIPKALEMDSSPARLQIAAHGRSLFRFLSGEYRKAMAHLRGVVTGELPKAFPERLALIDLLVEAQECLRKIRASETLGAAAFGVQWRQEATDWKQAQSILDWVRRQNEAGLGGGFREMFATVTDQAKIAALTTELRARQAAAIEKLNGLVQELCLDCGAAFGASTVEAVLFDSLAERFAMWLANSDSLCPWNNYFLRAKAARAKGMSSLVELLEDGRAGTKDVLVCFDRIYFGQLLRDIVRKKPALGQFDGDLHQQHVTDFRRLDTDRISLAKYRTLLAHFERMPPPNTGVGAAGIVKAEMERKRGHRTVRKLLRDAGAVVQAIKPVFMMSPLSVAQFLEPGAAEFDLLVIDEASQVQPVDALGAVARCKQIVVVGDSKQLPPTQFFTRLTTESPDELDEQDTHGVAQAQDIESILGLCRARGLPEKMLRWHYRSRHHSLIAVSNHEFYEDRLFVVPSPYSAAGEFGLKLHHIADGVFDSGATGANRIEARAVGRAVIDHARNHPALSLGVAAFSVRQRQAIHDELELLRRENPDTEAFFAAHPTEPFFVKNLENVQGDERDVIFISVGYGRDAHGYLAMRFGPLGAEGGERRLNVLISRAKKCCEIFSSIAADDIDLARAGGRGVAALKTYLAFAQTGRLATAAASGLEEQSPFEESVRRAAQTLGYEVHTQVGIAGFFIDLALVDKKTPGRYVLGIECDGASYHSSRSARDRDRLRQAVLEDHGWIMHRIWSTDWFQRPAEQLRKIADAALRAEEIIAELAIEKPAAAEIRTAGHVGEAVERDTPPASDSPALQEAAVAYREAVIPVPSHIDPHLVSANDMAQIIFKIIEIEGPVHAEEVTNRVRILWGLSRAGARVQDAVASGIRSLVMTNKCAQENNFLGVVNQTVTVRNRELVSSAELRKPEMIAPAEIRAGIFLVIDISRGASRKEIPPALARMLGFKVTSPQLRIVIDAEMTRLVQGGGLIETNGMLKRPTATGS